MLSYFCNCSFFKVCFSVLRAHLIPANKQCQMKQNCRILQVLCDVDAFLFVLVERTRVSGCSGELLFDMADRWKPDMG